MNFQPPAKSDVISSDLQSTSCEVLKIDSMSFVSDASITSDGKIIEFKNKDWDSHIISASVTIDSGVASNKSACGFGNLEQEYLYLYLFDGLVAQSDALIPLMANKNYTKQPFAL